MAGASFSSIMRKLDGKLKADRIVDGNLKPAEGLKILVE